MCCVEVRRLEAGMGWGDREGSSGLPPSTGGRLPFLLRPGPPVLSVLLQDPHMIPQPVSFEPADSRLKLGQGHGGAALAEDPAQGGVVGMVSLTRSRQPKR